jgi:hypothetical protein
MLVPHYNGGGFLEQRYGGQLAMDIFTVNYSFYSVLIIKSLLKLWLY